MSITYAAVTAHAWMNESGHGTYHNLHRSFLNQEMAVENGISVADGTDDFLIATIDGGRLLDIVDSDLDPLDWPHSDYVSIAEEFGLVCVRDKGDRL